MITTVYWFELGVVLLAPEGCFAVRCGKLIVATNEAEAGKLASIEARARANGVEDMGLLSAEEARALEPALACTGALLSPDGRALVFVSTRAGGTADLWTMDLQTRRTKALTSGPGGDFRPSWSPDGQWIAFASNRTSDLPFGHGEAVIHRAGGHAQRGLRQAGARRPEDFALHEPPERHDPRAQDHRGQGAPAHERAASLRRSTASNASRSAGVSTTKETSAGKAAVSSGS